MLKRVRNSGRPGIMYIPLYWRWKKKLTTPRVDYWMTARTNVGSQGILKIVWKARCYDILTLSFNDLYGILVLIFAVWLALLWRGYTYINKCVMSPSDSSLSILLFTLELLNNYFLRWPLKAWVYNLRNNVAKRP